MASKTRVFFLNAISLTLTALIIRGVAVIFNIYVSNRAGSEAMGLYSLLGSVYGFSITLAAAGINLGTTRLVSDAIGLNDVILAKRSAKKTLIYCIITGSVATALLYFGAPILAKGLLGDARAIRPLKILSFSLVPVAVCSCLSGYFNAVRRVRINATFQIAVQLCRIAITVVLLALFVDRGTEEACIALVLGGTLAEFISLTASYILYRVDIKKLSCEDGSSASETTKKIKLTKKLLGITIPVTLSACIRSALSMLQHALIPKGLRASGQTWSGALSSYGALHGMALPVVLFPSAFVSAFAGLLIPEISECCVQKNTERLRRVSFRALTLSLIFSIGVAGIMLFFSNELGMLIYDNEETALYIRTLAPLIPVMYIDSAVDAILKGTGHQVYSMNVNIADTLTACVFALTLIPAIGIWGYVISIYATEILNTSLSIMKMISVSKIKPRVLHQVAMPIICIVGATNAAKLILVALPWDVGGVSKLIFGIMLTVAIYIGLLFITRTIGKDEGEFLYASLLSEKSYERKFRAVQ